MIKEMHCWEVVIVDDLPVSEYVSTFQMTFYISTETKLVSEAEKMARYWLEEREQLKRCYISKVRYLYKIYMLDYIEMARKEEKLPFPKRECMDYEPIKKR